MNMTVSVQLNLKSEEAVEQVTKASRLGMRDTIVAVTSDAVKLSPWRTGNNRRSIAGEVSNMGTVASGGEGRAERIVDDSKIEGAVFSTSGYGGFLETGTRKMAARPYFKPALDRNFTEEKFASRVKEHLE